MKDKCPGSKEITSPTPEDIKCPRCGGVSEIWSDEPEIHCNFCGIELSRDMKTNCLKWCPAAKECVGSDKYEGIIRRMKE